MHKKVMTIMAALVTGILCAASDSDKIDAMISKACSDGSRTVTISKNPDSENGVWWLDRAILLPSDFKLIIDDCRIQLKKGVQDNLIRNKGAVEGNIVPDKNIIVSGKGTAVLCGGTENHYAPNRSGDVNGWRTIGILFCAVTGFTIEDITLEETQAWGISIENGCSKGRVSRINFNDSNKMRNQDGVDIRKGCHDILIEDITGVAGDDVVALTGLRRKPDSVRYRGRKGMQIGGSFVTDNDDIHDITIRNIKAWCSGGHGIVRLLCQDGIQMYNITLENLIDTTPKGKPGAMAALRIGDTSYWSIKRCEMGDMRNIKVKGVKSRAKTAVMIKGILADSVIEDVTAIPGTTLYTIHAPVSNVKLLK